MSLHSVLVCGWISLRSACSPTLVAERLFRNILRVWVYRTQTQAHRSDVPWICMCMCERHVAGNIEMAILVPKCCRAAWSAAECFDSGPTKPQRFYSYAHIISAILSGLRRRWCRRRIFITKPKVNTSYSESSAQNVRHSPQVRSQLQKAGKFYGLAKESQGKHRSNLIGNHFMSKINTLQANWSGWATGKFVDVLLLPRQLEHPHPRRKATI